MKSDIHKKEKRNLYIIIIAAILLIITFFLDKQIIAFIQSIQTPLLTYLFSIITNSILITVILVLIPLLFMWNEKKKEYIVPLAITFIITAGLSVILKLIISRERPIDTEFFTDLLRYSFPSTHTAITACTLPILTKVYPRLNFFWITFFILIAFSRLYLLSHYMTDIIAGALLGYLVTTIVIHIKNKYLVL